MLAPAGRTVASSTTVPSTSTTSPARTFARAGAPNRTVNSASTGPPCNRTRAGPNPSRTGSGAGLITDSIQRHRLEDLGARLRCAGPQLVCRHVVGLGLRQYLGLHPRGVVADLTLDIVGRPPQHGRNHVGNFPGAVDAAV